MKEKVFFVFLFICALLDELLTGLWPVDFTFSSFSVVFHLCFCALLLTTMKESWLDRILIAAAAGIVTDVAFTQTYLLYVFVYPLCTFAIGFLLRGEWERFRYQCILVLIFVFLEDIFLFMGMSMTKHLSVPFWLWFIKLEIPTLLVHIPCIVGLLYAQTILSRFIVIRQHRKEYYRRRRLSRS